MAFNVNEQSADVFEGSPWQVVGGEAHRGGVSASKWTSIGRSELIRYEYTKNLADAGRLSAAGNGWQSRQVKGGGPSTPA